MQINKILSKSFADKQFHLPPIEIPADASYSLTHLKLRFAHQVAYRVYDEFNQKDIIKNEDGSFSVSIMLPEDDWLYGFLLSFGTAVQILEPLNIKKKISYPKYNMT